MKTAMKTLALGLTLCWTLFSAPAHAQQTTCNVESTGQDVDFGTYQGNANTVGSPGAWRFVCKNGTPQPSSKSVRDWARGQWGCRTACGG